MRTEALFQFMQARYDIWKARQRSFPYPWSQDEILNNYRFCNIYRELDKVTLWVGKNWREPHKDDPDLWFALLAARWFNLPETLDAMGYPVPYNLDKVLARLRNREAQDNRLYNNAYMITTHGASKDKLLYILENVLGFAWQYRDKKRPKKGETLQSFSTKLMMCPGMGTFMVGQVIADIKYAPILQSADDWWTYAVSGPGSRRGLARVMEFDVKHAWRESHWHSALMTLKLEIDPLLKKAKMPSMHAQDLQNCLCEFDKYERVRLGQGVPKQLYKPADGERRA